MAESSTGLSAESVKNEISKILQTKSFEIAIEDKDFVTLLKRNAESTSPIFSKQTIDAILEARELRKVKRVTPSPTSFFFSNKSVLMVPGFMGSQLRDVKGDKGLIWVDPSLYLTSTSHSSELSALRLDEYQQGVPDHEADDGVEIHEDGAVPIVYSGLKYYLESGRCEVRTAAFDWRKDIDESAENLMRQVQSFAAEFPRRPLFVIAHSQGSLVARRALQMLGKEKARRLVNRLILLGPASYGTFSAAFAIGGNHELIAQMKDFGFEWPDDINEVLQSMSGVYQLLPWKPGTVAMTPEAIQAMGNPDTWKGKCDPARLQKYFKWAESIDTEFFNDRISILLGDDDKTPNAVTFNDDGIPNASGFGQGDGTVPDECAILEGVNDVARAPGASHMTLPLNPQVMQAVWRMIEANVTVQAMAPESHVNRVARVTSSPSERFIPKLPPLMDLCQLAGVKSKAMRAVTAAAAPTKVTTQPYAFESPAPPAKRRLRVFSFDPLLASDPDAMGTESIVLELDWDDESADGSKLQPGPVGEYLEVVDFDPLSGCFYAPVDLNHPNLLAQDGIPISVSNPQFHQQMVYAVGMTVIAAFERALGRCLQWSPDLRPNAEGNLRPGPNGEYVRRLRIYPHALRSSNAFYDPSRKAILLGYFRSQSTPGSKILPSGTVFTCLSFDIIAHEMTHAILDGMHRTFMNRSNKDVIAFHEAFADIVALFLHFSHPEVLRSQIAKIAGKLDNEGMLGNLAQQVGEGKNKHGALRAYLGEPDDSGIWKPTTPDPQRIAKVTESHERGAILVAAMFTAFKTIYKQRTADLVRIATGGSGIQGPGELHPDLVNRLAKEAAKSARHLLTMAIRAIDYVPPVDITFGEYLRALITADYDIIPDSNKYRIAIVDAFRQWGIYPEHVNNLSVESLLWNPTSASGVGAMKNGMELFREIVGVVGGTLKIDRADMYERQQNMQIRVHEWLRDCFIKDPLLARDWGLNVSPTAPQTIGREKPRTDGSPTLPKFEVRSLRRCRRIGPDTQERLDILIEVLQSRAGYDDINKQRLADLGQLDMEKDKPDFKFRGGVTLIVDPRAGQIRYAIRKSISVDGDSDLIEVDGKPQLRNSQSRLNKTRKYLNGTEDTLGLHANYFQDDGNPFPRLHVSE